MASAAGLWRKVTDDIKRYVDNQSRRRVVESVESSGRLRVSSLDPSEPGSIVIDRLSHVSASPGDHVITQRIGGGEVAIGVLASRS